MPSRPITTDLLTPLGAYLRLRERRRARASCSSRSSRAGSAATRSSAPARGSSRSRRPSGCGEPVVGYLAYDHVAKLEPTVPLPDDGPGLPESRFVVADTLVRFDHGSGMAEVLARRRATTIAALLGGDAARRPPRRAARDAARVTRRLPVAQAEYEAACVAMQGAHPRRATPSRSCSRSAPSGRRRRRALELYRALRRVNPSPYLFLLELDGLALVGSSPETLVKCEGGRASLNPIAGTTQPGEGDAERLLASEKDRAEHVMLVDLGRNDLSRVCRAGHRARRALPRAGALLARHAPRLRGRRRAARRASRRSTCCARCFPAGTVSGAPKVRAMQIISELEGYRRGPYAGAVGYALPGGDARHVHRDPDDRPRTTASRSSRPAPGSSPTPTRRPSTRSACASSPRSRPRSSSRRRSA